MTPPATIEAVSAAWHYECDRWRLRVTNHAFNFVRDRDPDGPISVDTFELRGSGDENAFAAMRDAACAQAAITAHLSALQAQGMVIVPREPTSEAIDNARLVGPIMLVERDVGAPYARTLLAEEALAIYRAMITAANPTP